ncbi:MAG: GFA family protein [Reyranella sp.]|uniref:GFA family protein n=1 Tax=Reyranella sp. TaxID=1929291 RepID=UPI001AC1EDBA|nr:GFA family protein [Reyranella sp.]MBN9087863.1 GFA family protein [Reyranella sp.]
MILRVGGCLCGAVRYESGGEPQFSLQCHCRDCQRQSGAPHVAAVRVPSAAFRIVRGTPKRYIAKADSGNDITRVFCGDCGTPLYVQVSTRPDIVGVRVCTFDDPAGSGPKPTSSPRVPSRGTTWMPRGRDSQPTQRARRTRVNPG